MGFLAPAAPTVLPMLIGAGAGAMLDKNNPMRGALLGAVGGHALAPAVTALGGIGTAGMGAEAALAANPVMIMGAEAAGGLPSMASVASTMPGGMAAPGAIGANGIGFGANALTAANAYNAMPVMDRLGALVHAPTKEGLLKSAGRMVMGQEQQQPQPMPMAPPPMPPRPTQAGPMPQVNRFVTGMSSMARRRDPREEMWGYS